MQGVILIFFLLFYFFYVIYKGVQRIYLSKGEFPPFAFKSQDNIKLAIVHLGVRMLLCDSRNFNRKKIKVGRFLKAYYNFDPENESLRDLLSNSIQLRLKPVSVARWLSPAVSVTMRENILNFLFDLAASDGLVGPKEEKILKDVAQVFGISEKWISDLILENRRIYAEQEAESRNSYQQRVEKNESSDHFAVLGLQAGADDKMIRKKYRELVMKYHPDKFHNQSEDVRANANSRFLQIQEAYEYLMESV